MTPELPSQAEAVHAGGAVVAISRRAADRLRAGHLWVYRSELQPFSAAEPGRGELVTAVDGRGLALGTAIYSVGSQIALRLVSGRPALPRELYLADLERRIRAAVALRDEIAPLSPENNARRLLFSEGDEVPGIVADQYGEIVVAQLLVQGTAQMDVRHLLSRTLPTVFDLGSGTIWERADSRIREMEALDLPPESALWAAIEPLRTSIFTINGVRFHYDAGSGQKTGAFLDQRLNYQAAAQHAKGRALDVCTYQGGFALHLAARCEGVTGVDASRAALEIADRNLELNRAHIRTPVDWIEADAFDLMREYQESGEQFGTIVLDPPAFSKAKRSTEGALRGYKELNLRAMRMLEPGGTLVTCSCSHHVSLAEFLEVVGSAATDAHRRVQVLEVRGAAPDHPAMLALPETSYLKCLICRIS